MHRDRGSRARSEKAQRWRFDEKVAILSTIVKALDGRGPVVAGISALSTAEAVALAKAAEGAGCSGLMVLPPYVYLGDWRENKAHVAAVFQATKLSCMLYNNPVAYKVDYVPEQVQELLAEFDNLHAIKESSADVRRVAALKSLVGDRLRILVGVDDAIVESIYMGAVGWVAGLVNAFPKESVDLFNLAQTGQHEKAFELYSWFLPMLPHGHHAQVHPVHQAGSGRNRDGERSRSSASHAGDWRRVGSHSQRGKQSPRK